MKPHYLPGRMGRNKANGSNTRELVHLVEPIEAGVNMNRSLCGYQPGRKSYGWEEADEQVTCERCKQISTHG